MGVAVRTAAGLSKCAKPRKMQPPTLTRAYDQRELFHPPLTNFPTPTRLYSLSPHPSPAERISFVAPSLLLDGRSLAPKAGGGYHHRPDLRYRELCNARLTPRNPLPCCAIQVQIKTNEGARSLIDRRLWVLALFWTGARGGLRGSRKLLNYSPRLPRFLEAKQGQRNKVRREMAI